VEGWIKLYRKSLEHWLYNENRPHTKREAWEDILLHCNHSDEKVLIGNELIDCKRGQTVKSLGTWSKKFNWTISKVRRFLILLQKDSMICFENVKKTTRITICNYEIYQGERNDNEKQVKSKRKASETQVKTNKNEKNVNNEKKLEERQLIFKKEVESFIDKYDIKLLTNFYAYWSEPNKSKTKMRCEMQQTWETKRRLVTWNNKNFNTQKNTKQYKNSDTKTYTDEIS
jgi:hypothetical protein